MVSTEIEEASQSTLPRRVLQPGVAIGVIVTALSQAVCLSQSERGKPPSALLFLTRGRHFPSKKSKR